MSAGIAIRAAHFSEDQSKIWNVSLLFMPDVQIILKSLANTSLHCSHYKETEAVAQRCSLKVFLEILQNSQENTCAIILQAEPATLLKKRL